MRRLEAVFAGILLCASSAVCADGQQAVAPQPGAGATPPAVVVSQHNRDRAQKAFVEGARAVDGKDLHGAVAAFTRAVSLNPSDANYDAALAIARDNLATQLVQEGLKARLAGDETTFHARLVEAAALDSHNPLVLEHAKDLAGGAAPEPAVLDPVRDNVAPPVELEPAGGTHSFHLKAPKGELLRQVLIAYGVVPTIDSSFEGAGAAAGPVSLDLDDVTWTQAEQAAELATGTFVVPLDPTRALVALDTKENRAKYERLAMETVYLPGLTVPELNDMANIARTVFEASQISLQESKNTLTLRAPERRMRAFNFEVNELLAGRSETMLDVDIYEVQTELTGNEGVQLPQTSTVFNLTSEVNSLIKNNPSLVQEIISSGLASPGNVGEIAIALIASGQAGSSVLSQPFAYFGGGLTTTALTLTQAEANLQMNSSDTRMLDKLQLRLVDQEEGTIKIGERYPIVTSSYSNLATGSTSIAGINSAGLSNTLQNLGINLSALSSAASAAVPQVQYQDVGLKLTATTRVQQGREISLKLKLQLSSLSGATLNSNPIINNREADSDVTVKPGERTVLVSQLSNQESASLIGLPFLSEIPGFEFGTNTQTTKTRDSLVILLTPHIVRLSHTEAQGAMVRWPTHS